MNVKFPPKRVKKQRTGHISEAISHTDFILQLGTNVQLNKAHSTTYVPMGQGQIFPQKGKKTQRTCHISKAISPTDFIFGTKPAKVQPKKTHSMTQVMMTLTECQDQRSWMLFHLQTSYLVQSNQAHSMIHVSMRVTAQVKVKSFKKGYKKLNYWPYLGCYFIHRLHHIYFHSFL